MAFAPILFVWSRFQWHSPGIAGSEGGFGVIFPIFSLVWAWKFEVQQKFRRIYWVGEVVGAWKGLGSYVQQRFETMKVVMPFLKFKKDETLDVGPKALNVKLPFDEMQVLQENVDLIKRQIGLEKLEIFFYYRWVKM